MASAPCNAKPDALELMLGKLRLAGNRSSVVDSSSGVTESAGQGGDATWPELLSLLGLAPA